MPTTLVTGASRGIGRAIALQLAAEGHDIAVHYSSHQRAAEEVAELVRAQGPRAVAIGADLSDPANTDALIDCAEGELGPISILVANAGIASDPTGVTGITDEAWDRMLAVNLTSPFRIARRLAPAMAEAGFGRIVMVSSIAAFTGGLVGAHYAASKSGLNGLARSLAKEMAGRGVTVNVVAPALIETDMVPVGVRDALAQHTPVGRLGRSEEVADIVAAVIRNGYMTGQSVLLDGGRHFT
ncbi:MAG TPA: SDR family NAD(P)-dependent oxidoreductase [Solirubrobacteraceae bacterium]|nr:SDR family NAD(P)-dependent oxidoreductase [Solirubrobacteraceae bacterium]